MKPFTLASVYESWEKHLSERLQYNTTDLSWLLHHPTPIKEYAHLNQFGTSWLSQSLNSKISQLSPRIWQTIVWPQFIPKILSTVAKKYLPDVLAQLPGHPEPRFFLKALHTLLDKASMCQASFSELYTLLNDALIAYSVYSGGSDDIYKRQKEYHSQQCLPIFHVLKETLNTHPDPLGLCLYLAIRGNWLDCTEDNPDDFLCGFKEEVNDCIESESVYTPHNPYYHLHRLKNWLKTPITILYECDNSGEAILDAVLILYLLAQGHHIIVAAKESPVLNDITINELTTLYHHDLTSSFSGYLDTGQCQLISTGSSIGGKSVYRVSDAYKKAYERCQLVILKGQGNFLTMPMGRRVESRFQPYLYKKPHAYLLGVKSPFLLNNFKALYTNKHLAPMLSSTMAFTFNSAQEKTYAMFNQAEWIGTLNRQ